MDKPFRINYGVVELANQVTDMKAKFRNVWSGTGRLLRENRKCFSVSWSQGEDDDYDYRVSVVPMKIHKIEKCKQKMPSAPGSKWENIICAGDIPNPNWDPALMQDEDLGSPLVCLFYVKNSLIKSRRQYVPMVSGIIMNQELTNPVLYTKTAPFSDSATQVASKYKPTATQRNSGDKWRVNFLFEMMLCLIIVLF